MTETNVYGLRARGVEAGYDWSKWEWGAVPDNIIQTISIEAAKTVMEDFKENGRLVFETESDDSIAVHLLVGDDLDLWKPFAELISTWVSVYEPSHPDDVRPMVAALEDALTKVKAMLRD
jgi:hypothetical protein